jgi:D-alanyl-D-alanine carboxypeptidase (penicillin-binding protein 5/6)
LLCVLCIAVVSLGGCSFSSDEQLSNPYAVYDSPLSDYGDENSGAALDFFAEHLCVTDGTALGTDKTNAEVAEAAGVFNLNTEEVSYCQNVFARLYPASTTKIMTAYLIIKYGNLSDTVTVSANAVDLDSDSSVCDLKEGDVITVEDLLYGLMLESGNDAAIALAEYYAGSVEAFADVMNQTAAELGATGTHFVNPNGLPDENHYTTVYDMYLIFKEAIELEPFVTIIGTTEYEASYQNKNGEAVSRTWKNTNRYLQGTVDTPDGFTIIGGKTGTTNAAGYCLVLYSTNEKDERIISIVFKADGRSNLYLLMNQILSGFAK